MRREELGLRNIHIFVGDHPHFWYPSDQRGRRELKHRVRDCSRARSFTAPQTGGTTSMAQKGNKSVASPSVPRQGTETLVRQDGRASARAYAMKAVEDTDAPDVIVGNFQIFDTTYMH